MSMPWHPRIFLFTGLFTKAPTLAIAEQLHAPVTQVVGCLGKFWLEAQVKADARGVLEKKTAAWLDALVGTPGFAAAMVVAGWLRITPTALEVVNFNEWVSKKATKRIENAMRMADKREADSADGDDYSTHNRTQPHTTAHKQPVVADKPKKSRAKQANVTDVRFWKFWQAYPKKWNQPAAYKEWTKLNPDDALVETILASIEAWKSHPQWSKDNGEYIPNPVNWLAGRRWQDSTEGGRGVPGGPRLQPKPGGYRTGRSYSSDAGDPVPPGPAPDGGGGPSLF